jgi:flagellar motor switch protein FliN/FliY
MSAQDALERLGQSSAEACLGVLEMFAAGKVSMGEVTVSGDVKSAFSGVPVPAVAMSVSYIDGVTGGNVFLITLEGARKLAASMMGIDEPGEPETPGELSELELSAVSEAMNQMMASAAGATSSVLGTEVEIGTPDSRTFTAGEDIAEAYPATPHAVRTAMSICGEPARLVQLVPNAFVVRMSSALDDLGAEMAPAALAAAGGGSPAVPATPSLAGIPVRVWAELGRARMPSAQVVGLPPGAVVELDRQADDPIDLYVNGTLFATGRLVVVDDTDWAVRIEHVLDKTQSSADSGMEVARWPESW